MASRPENRSIARIALLIAVSFCSLSMAQIARPLRSADRAAMPLIAAPQQHLTRHTLQEVSPRGARLRAPTAVGLLPIVRVSDHGRIPRTAAYVPIWPMEYWPVHRRTSPDSADTPAVPA